MFVEPELTVGWPAFQTILWGVGRAWKSGSHVPKKKALLRVRLFQSHTGQKRGEEKTGSPTEFLPEAPLRCAQSQEQAEASCLLPTGRIHASPGGTFLGVRWDANLGGAETGSDLLAT